MIANRETSLLMRVLAGLRLYRWAWSARRLHCPVSPDALVLDVGSGSNPYPRANVLLDAYEETQERYHMPLIKDRPIVLGVAEQMPFRDQAFDFVIASHLLEHTSKPEKFIAELMRVSKAGYIETPDGFFERFCPYNIHRLEISLRDGVLWIFKKPSWRHDGYIVDLYNNHFKSPRFNQFMSTYPETVYLRYYWEHEIKYKVVNPEVDAGWPISETHSSKIKTGLRYFLVSKIRTLFSQRHRNANFDLASILACPSCHSVQLKQSDKQIECVGCGEIYPVTNGIPRMYPPADHCS